MIELHKSIGSPRTPEPATILVTTCDRIPLSLFCPGGLALVVNFIGCPYRECPVNPCPWSADLDSRSARTIDLRFEYLTSIVSSYNPDIVFFHGAEPCLYEKLPKLISSLKVLPIGMKLRARTLSKHNETFKALVRSTQLLLIEVIDLEDVLHISKSLNLIHNHIIEFVIPLYSISESHIVLAHLVELLNELKLNDTAVNLIPVAETITSSDLLRLVDSLRKRYVHIYVPSSPIAELASIFCPSCKLPIVVRQSYTLIKYGAREDGECRYCGTKVLTRVAKRRLRIPIEEIVR